MYMGLSYLYHNLNVLIKGGYPLNRYALLKIIEDISLKTFLLF